MIDIQTHIGIKPKILATFILQNIFGPPKIKGLVIKNVGSIPIKKVEVTYRTKVYGQKTFSVYENNGEWLIFKNKKILESYDSVFIPLKDKYLSQLILDYEWEIEKFPKDRIKESEMLLLANIIRIRYYHYLDNTEYIKNKVLVVDKGEINGKIAPIIFTKDDDSFKTEWSIPKLISKIEEIEDRSSIVNVLP